MWKREIRFIALLMVFFTIKPEINSWRMGKERCIRIKRSEKPDGKIRRKGDALCAVEEEQVVRWSCFCCSRRFAAAGTCVSGAYAASDRFSAGAVFRC